MGAAAQLQDWPDERALSEVFHCATRAAFNDEAFAAAWEAGRVLSLEHAVAEALAWKGS